MQIQFSDHTFPFEGYQTLPPVVTTLPPPELRFGNNNVNVSVTEINITDAPAKGCCSAFGGGFEDVIHEAAAAATTDEDLFSMYIDLEKLEEEERQEGNNDHDDDSHVNGGGFVIESGDDGGCGGGRKRKRKKDNKNVKNQMRKAQKCNKEKSCSVDDGGALEPRKAILAEELAKLWVINPKRAQRIMSNRQSAARSKEKKAKYTVDLEKKVKTLHAKTQELSLQLAENQEEIASLSAEKSELELQLQTMENQVKICDAQSEELQMEIESLKAAIGETDYSDWLNMRMNHIPQSPSNSNLALPQLPTSPLIQQQKLLPQVHSSQLIMPTQYLHTS